MLKTMFPTINRESSMLGFGCMRFPTTPEGKIDEAEAIRMIRHAIDSGVTYIDTAYPYHGGESEVVVGKALQDGYREKVILTTKLPCWNVKTYEDMMRLLDEQLAKLQTDHVDFYILHAMNKDRLKQMQELDYKKFYAEAMAQGKVRYPGFSFHDDAETFIRILDDWDQWKMAQVQMNILDDENQATLAGIREAGKRGVGVVIMEPLRGGMLANPPADVAAVYDAFADKRSPVEWAFRYLYAMPEVITILSGMSNWEQVTDNLRIFDIEARPELTEAEEALFRSAKATYMARTKTRCTGCRYCQPCPMGVQIPRIFQGYDGAMLYAEADFSKGYARIVADEADASRCVQCRQCESNCPQHLPIVEFLQEIHEASAAK
ncbi:MAG: aldo/keto reductase [Clostridiales bacterium]|nr:aldo/keto reductase [Clostridiales bacterium]